MSSGRWYPPPSRPRAADGLKARSQRGAIGTTWWSSRFIDVLETFGMGNRLSRGRTYARRGQVLDIDVAPGLVLAHVQGSRKKPYQVRIGVRAFGKTEWLAVADAMAADAWYAAKLLSGEMPQDIEDLFEKSGLTLFPESIAEVGMDCSCPDWEVPCKHIAAVFYLLAEAFDDDPFLILAWRGRERDDLLTAVAGKRAGAGGLGGAAGPVVPELGECLDSYFTGRPLAPSPVVIASRMIVPDQLPEVGPQARGLELAGAIKGAYEFLEAVPDDYETDDADR